MFVVKGKSAGEKEWSYIETSGGLSVAKNLKGVASGLADLEVGGDLGEIGFDGWSILQNESLGQQIN